MNYRRSHVFATMLIYKLSHIVEAYTDSESSYNPYTKNNEASLFSKHNNVITQKAMVLFLGSGPKHEGLGDYTYYRFE